MQRFSFFHTDTDSCNRQHITVHRYKMAETADYDQQMEDGMIEPDAVNAV
jgi:hypothetical protein